MISKRQLHAFTILEVTIAMLLAAITIGTAYTAYRIMGKLYKDFDRKNEQLSEFVLSCKLLRQDFTNARSIVSSEKGLTVETGEGIIGYSFEPEYLVRCQYQLRRDTLHIPSKDLMIAFKNKTVAEGTLIDQLSFTTELYGRNVELRFDKIYSSQDLMM